MHFHPSCLPEVRAAGPIMPLLRLTTRFPQFFLHEKSREIKRIIQYLAEKAAHGTTRYRIGKDLTRRIHCCLIPWDVLDSLSESENKVTGGHVDYKQMDRDNVLALPELLRACQEDV